MKKRNKGITLIALVITIIVLLILAGVAISTLTGDNGILNKASQSAIQTEIAKIEEEARLIAIELIGNNYDGTKKEVTLSDIASELINKGYDIESKVVAGGTITDITLDNSNLSISVDTTGTIKVSYEGSSEGLEYYAKVKGEYYKMDLKNGEVTIERKPTKIDSGSNKLEAKVTSGSSVTKVEVNGNEIKITAGANTGKSTITVTYGSFTKTCDVTVVKTPTETSEENKATTFSTSYGKIDIVWLDENNNIRTTPEPPVLTSNGEAMTPVTWSESTDAEGNKTWSEDGTAKSSWYNYKAGTGTEDNLTSEWANAKTKNGSYFVWIPRYAYRITYYASSTSTEPTGYYDGWGMYDAVNGQLKYKITEADGIQTVNHNGTKYIVHPAFETNLDNGGWSNDLKGFWFAKYEMSGSGNATSSTDTLKSVPNEPSLRSTSIGNQYRYARNANYGYTGQAETITSGGTEYTHTSYMNSHLVKNSEWGAVAYLTQSQYGRNGHEIDINNSSSYITGNGGGSTSASSASGTINAYNTAKGAKASTTGNVYGIYDMSGGAWEYAASYDKLGSSSYVDGSSYGQYMTQEAKNSEGNYISTKYVTAYENGTTSYYGNAIIYKVGKIGDATKEVNTGGSYADTSTNQYNNWFSDYPSVAYSSDPFFIRGGNYSNGSGAGVFYSSSNDGYSSSSDSFRAVLCP